MLCPSCQTAAPPDASGRCTHCGYLAAAVPPPGYYPTTYVSPQAPTGIATAVQVLLAVGAVFLVLITGAEVYVEGIARNDSGYDAGAAALSLLSFVNMLLFLATAVCFMVWSFKSAKLSAILAPGRQALGPGWAIGGWFIPLAFLVLPRILIGGIWRAALPLQPTPAVRKPRTLLVTFWWLTLVGSELVGGTAGGLSVTWTVSSDGSTDLTDSQALSVMGIAVASDVLRLAAAVLAILMIRKITAMQQVRILQGPAPQLPPVPFPAQPSPAEAVDLDK